jgi:hypothetical protein
MTRSPASWSLPRRSPSVGPVVKGDGNDRTSLNRNDGFDPPWGPEGDKAQHGPGRSQRNLPSSEAKPDDSDKPRRGRAPKTA